MKALLSKFFIIVSMLLVISACGQNYRSVFKQKIELRDSLYILHTLKEWHKINWSYYEDYSRMYQLNNEQVEISIERFFFSPDKLKMIALICEKMPNAKTLEKYSEDSLNNRICPTGGDTIYLMSALIGFRESIHQLWILYPLALQFVDCSPSKEMVLKYMESFLSSEMKNKAMWKIKQEGKERGQYELKEFGYNIQDSSFWNKCWLWEKDTVGADGKYWFQVEQYGNGMGAKICNKCANLIELPRVIYPDSILQMYR
jgi:hypothetical protein